MPEGLLEIEGLSKRFGGVVASDSISLSVPSQAVEGLQARDADQVVDARGGRPLTTFR